MFRGLILKNLHSQLIKHQWIFNIGQKNNLARNHCQTNDKCRLDKNIGDNSSAHNINISLIFMQDMQIVKLDGSLSMSALNIDQQPKFYNNAVFAAKGSELLSKYMEILNIPNLKQCEERRNINMRNLIQQGMQIDDDSKADLKITLTQWSQDYQYVLLNVSYNHFLFYVSILNINHKSPMHQIKNCFTGNFSSVYHAKIEGMNTAVKCNNYTKKNFLSVFKNTLQEYLAYQIASKLNSGPKMLKAFGFDILVYSDCIEYSMEFCRQQLKAEPRLERDLKEALRNFHSLKIIHFDIKPENICYSEEYGRYVFIDLGLHKVITEDIGEKTYTNYQGSLLFCSEEMRDCFLNGRRPVDLYYNDALCLEESLKEITKMKKKKKNNISEDISNLSQTQFMITVKMKYFLSNSQKNENAILNELFFQKINTLRGEYYESIKHFLYNLNYSTRLEEIIVQLGNYSQQFPIQSIISKKMTQTFLKNNQQQQENPFEMKMKFLQKLNRQTTSLTGFQAKRDNNLKDHIIFLCDEEKVKKWEDKLYYLFVSELIQINSWRTTIDEKQQLCTTFNKVNMNINGFQKLNIEQKTRHCLQFLLKFILKQVLIDSIIYCIIKYSLPGVLIMQIYTQQDYLSLAKELIIMKCSLKIRIRLIYFMLSCLQWLLYHSSTSYCYFYLRNQLYRFILSIQNKFRQTKDEKEDFLANLLIKFIEPSMHQTKDKMLRQNIKILHEKLHFKTTKYFIAINEYEQILAEIFCFNLYLYIKQQNMTFKMSQTYDSFLKRNELLILISYQPYFFNYYQFVTNLQDHKNNYHFRFQKIKQLSSFYKCLAFQQVFAQSSIYEIVNDKFYFNDIDYSKFNLYFALLYRKKLLYMYYSIISRNNQLLFSIDIQSFRKNCHLRQVINFMPYLKQISSYEMSHQHEFSFCYKAILLSIHQYTCLYSKIQSTVDTAQTRIIERQMSQLIDNLSCCYCKVTCLISNLLPISSNSYLTCFQKNDNYILNMAVWLIKQSSPISNVRLVFMKNLCRISNKYDFAKLFIDHLIENNIVIEFLPLHIEEEEIKERVLILYSLLKHQKVFFQFIVAFCKSFNFLKKEKHIYLETFSAVIQTFFRQSIKSGKGLFNTSYTFLLQNRTQLRQIPYIAIYFGIALLNIKFISEKKIEPFYYNFIWSNYHKLSFRMKEVINGFILHSYIKNQVCYNHPKLRRVHFLQKFHVRTYFLPSFALDQITKRHRTQLQALRIKLGKNSKYMTIKKCIRKYFTVYPDQSQGLRAKEYDDLIFT